MRYLIFTIILIPAFVSVAVAQDSILEGGDLSGSNSWQGTILIRGDVTVPKGSQLTILPGTRILFSADKDQVEGGTDKTRSELIIRGKLVAKGVTENKIVFTSSDNAPRMGNWYGIEFLHSSAGSSIEYCVVEYAYNGITIKNSAVDIINSEIRYNYYAGLCTEVKAKPKIMQNIISENGYAGIICELGAAPLLTENLITQNPMGVVIMSLSQPNLGSNKKDETYNPGQNKFLNNEEYDIYNHSSKPVLAQNNTWESTNAVEIAQRIFDQTDNAKYGNINFQPVYNANRRQPELNRFILLAQNTNTTELQESTGGLAANNNANTVEQEQEPVDTATESAAVGIIDSTMRVVFEKQNNIEQAPLLAATQIPEEQIPVGNQRTATSLEKIDYDRVFLEPFLDSGRKSVIRKEPLPRTQSMRNMHEPGEIRIKVIVDQQGNVESAIILRGINGVLDEIVLDTVRKYSYRIGTVNGIPVRFTTNEVFRFK